MKNTDTDIAARLKHQYPLFISMAETVNDMVLLLDEDGYIVYFNRKFEEFTERQELSDKTGVRPGDAFKCINALTEPGCGRTNLCKYCGAAAVINSASAGTNSRGECKVASLNGKSYDLRVSTTKLKFFDKDYIMYCVEDVSSDYRKAALEKIFFHDINNLVWGLGLIVDTVNTAYKENDRASIEDTMPLLVSSVANLTNELKSSLLLSLAEKDELEVKLANVNVDLLIEDVIKLFREIIIDKKVKFMMEIEHGCSQFLTDEAILKRIVINMVKNAAEASSDGDTVIAGCKKTYTGIRIFVRNSAVMPEYVKAAVFKRSTSTKGSGRGLGTYSMRLLTERYLKGRVYFTSEEGFGTAFYAEIPYPSVSLSNQE